MWFVRIAECGECPNWGEMRMFECECECVEGLYSKRWGKLEVGRPKRKRKKGCLMAGGILWQPARLAKQPVC